MILGQNESQLQDIAFYYSLLIMILGGIWNKISSSKIHALQPKEYLNSVAQKNGWTHIFYLPINDNTSESVLITIPIVISALNELPSHRFIHPFRFW